MSQHKAQDQDQTTLSLQCHWCGHTGLTLWEKAGDGTLQFLSIEGFYERITKKQPFKMETICNTCNKAQPV